MTQRVSRYGSTCLQQRSSLSGSSVTRLLCPDAGIRNGNKFNKTLKCHFTDLLKKEKKNVETGAQQRESEEGAYGSAEVKLKLLSACYLMLSFSGFIGVLHGTAVQTGACVARMDLGQVERTHRVESRLMKEFCLKVALCS